MGRAFIDKFSLLHFATGIVAQFWGSALWQFVLGHVAFELLENTPTGMAVINMLPFWPGGKDKADTVVGRGYPPVRDPPNSPYNHPYSCNSGGNQGNSL